MWALLSPGQKPVHPVNGEVPPVKGRPRKLPHYANRGKTSSSGGELASARSCFSTVRTALGKLRITGLLAQFDVARSFPQFPRPLLLQPTILTSERGTRFGIRKAPNQVPPPHLPEVPKPSHGTGKGASGGGIAESGREELIGGEHRVFARPLKDGGKGLGQGGGAGNKPVHI